MPDPKVDVFMPWYVGDYLMATADLDIEEHGAYSLLLMHLWKRGGRLPLDHGRLARLCRVGADRWAEIWEVIGRFFTAADGHITQKRLSAELTRAQQFRSDQAKKGRKGAGARWGKSDEPQDAPAMPRPLAQAMPEHWPDDGPSPSPSPSPSESPSDPPADLQPDPARADPWGDPRARAIPEPDLVAQAWPEPEPEPEPVRVHHAELRPARRLNLPSGEGGSREEGGATAPPQGRPGVQHLEPPSHSTRDPPGVRAQRMVELFGRARSDVGQAHGRGTAPWHHGPRDFARAREFVDRLDDDQASAAVTDVEVERTMRAHLEWAVRQPERKHFEVGWAFACWIHRFSDLLEDVRGLRPADLPGLTDRERENLSNGQHWLRMKQDKERKREASR
jgi:uncharacterized protein YdaU (DUF1376 family)